MPGRTFYVKGTPPYPAGVFKTTGSRSSELDVWLKIDATTTVRIATERPAPDGLGLLVTVHQHTKGTAA